MFKKITKYNYKTLAMLGLMGMGACSLQSCGEDPIVEDINATKLASLRQDSTILVNEFREAIEPAKKSPNDITTVVDNNFVKAQNTLGITAANSKDSAEAFVKTVEIMREAYGDPVPKNNENLTNLETKSKTYVAKLSEMNDFYAQNQK